MNERARLHELDREVAELRMKREVLKRSVVLWVKEATRSAWPAAPGTHHGVPHAVAFRALDVSESWFYKWRPSRDQTSTTACEPGRQGGGGLRRLEVGDLIKRHFDAEEVDLKWCGDLTEIPTGEGKLYLAIVLDLASRRLPGFAIGEPHDAELAANALKMAAAIRGGDVTGVIVHFR